MHIKFNCTFSVLKNVNRRWSSTTELASWDSRLHIALVLGLMFLNIAVSASIINGLIFYANVVRANILKFPHQSSNSFLSVFIAWLNLDLGVEVCFDHEFDAYAKTWLQFMFPLYICFIVTVIIIISKYSMKVSKLLGSNCVQVLATFFFCHIPNCCVISSQFFLQPLSSIQTSSPGEFGSTMVMLTISLSHSSLVPRISIKVRYFQEERHWVSSYNAPASLN